MFANNQTIKDVRAAVKALKLQQKFPLTIRPRHLTTESDLVSRQLDRVKGLAILPRDQIIPLQCDFILEILDILSDSEQLRDIRLNDWWRYGTNRSAHNIGFALDINDQTGLRLSSEKKIARRPSEESCTLFASIIHEFKKAGAAPEQVLFGHGHIHVGFTTMSLIKFTSQVNPKGGKYGGYQSQHTRTRVGHEAVGSNPKCSDLKKTDPIFRGLLDAVDLQTRGWVLFNRHLS